MKLRLSLLISFFLLATTSQAKLYMKYGKISDEEIQMDVCPYDSNASAYVIGDLGNAKFQITQSDIKIIFSRHIRIKILEKESFDKGNFNIYLYKDNSGDEEKLVGLKGAVYNYTNNDLKKTKLTKSNIFKEDLNKSREIVKITMPNVQEGSIIDLTYTVESPYLFNLESWYFQDDIPTLYSEFNVEIIEWYNYKNWVEGYVNINKEEASSSQKFSFIKSAEIDPKNGRTAGGTVEFEAIVKDKKYSATNVPAFKDEPYITAPVDYLSSVHFELQSTKYPWSTFKSYTTTWEKINKLLLDHEDFGRTIKHNGHLKDKAASIKEKSDSDFEAAVLAYEHIKNRLAWDGRYSKLADVSIKSAYSEQSGNSADINLNLIALCRLMGLEVYPVIISTRNHGKVRPGQPKMSQFNHTIAAVKIEDNYLLLDAIDPNCPYNLLPANSLNDKGRIVNETGGEWIQLYSKKAKKDVHVASMSFDEDLNLNGQYSYRGTDYGALNFRNKFKKEESEDEFTIELKEKLGDVELKNVSYNNIDSLHKPVTVKGELIVSDGISAIGNMIYLNPKLINQFDENIFKSEERTYPIDYNYPVKQQHMFTIKLPDGYTVEEIPEPLVVSLPENRGRYIYMVKVVGNNIQFTNQFAINQTIFPGTQYHELKQFYEMIVAKEAEQIVLKQVN